MALRGYGWRAASGNSPSFSESAARFGFVELERVPERELVLGLAGRFWRPDGGLRKLSREAFPAFEEDGCGEGRLEHPVLAARPVRDRALDGDAGPLLRSRRATEVPALLDGHRALLGADARGAPRRCAEGGAPRGTVRVALPSLCPSLSD